MRTYTCTNIRAYIKGYTQAGIYTFAYTHTGIFIFMGICIHTDKHAYTQSYMHDYISTHIHT